MPEGYVKTESNHFHNDDHYKQENGHCIVSVYTRWVVSKKIRIAYSWL